MVSRAVPNIKSDRPSETREFFVDLQVTIGLITIRGSSRTSPCA
jgi:hypothetical protein